MIPAVLPPPVADAVPAATTGHGDAEQFAHALDRETGRARPAQGAERREPDRERAGDAPGEHGLDQALVVMPVDVPARPVVTGLVPHPLPTVDARPDDHPPATRAALDLGLAVEADPQPMPAVAAGLEAAPDPEPAVAHPEPVDDPDLTVARPVARTPEPSDSEAPASGPPGPETDGATLVGPDDVAAPATAEGAPAAPRSAHAADAPDGAIGVARPGGGGEPGDPRPMGAPGRTVAETTPAPQDPAPAPAPLASPALATVSAAPAAAAAPPAAPAAVAQQLVEHVSPLVQGPDGTHDLTIELRPATLGLVRLEVTLEEGTLHVRVHAEDPASRRLLAQSLTDLRTALTDAGIDAGRLDVGDPGGRHDPSGGAPGDHAPGRSATPPVRTTDASTPRNPTASRTSVDVLL